MEESIRYVLEHHFITYVFAATFLFYAAMLLVAHYRTKLSGLLLLAFTYGAGGLLAVFIPAWWPLVAGFVLAWMLKLTGADPDSHFVHKE